MPVGVCDPDRRIGLVDVLPAGAAGAERVDPQIVIPDFDIGEFVHLREHEDRSKRGMAPLGLVEG